MNPDLKMTEPMWIIEADLPEYAHGWQQDFMDLYSEVPNVLDPQLAFIVRNLAYQRALLIKQDQYIGVLTNLLEELVSGGSDD